MYPLLVLFLIYAYYRAQVDLQHFEEELIADNGMYQGVIFATLLFSSIMCFYRANILRPFRGTVFSGAQIILGFLFFCFAMDEISWMQRVFDFPSPQFFLKYNTKGQMNLHHLVIDGFYVNNIVFTLGVKIIASLYFLIFPFLYPKSEKLRFMVNRYAIPLPRYTQLIAYAVLALFVKFIPSEHSYVIFEFGFYWLLVLLMYNPINEEVFSRKSLVR